MNKVFLNFCKDRTYKYILFICIFLIMIGFSPLLNLTINDMNEKGLMITNVYLINAIVLPLAFNSSGLLVGCVMDICFLSTLLYPILQMVSYFFIDSSSITILKIGREKWLKKLIIMTTFQCFLFSLVYFVIVFISYCIKTNIFCFDISFLISFLLKCLISMLSISIYIWIYILLSDHFFALLSSITIFIVSNIWLYFQCINYVGTQIVFKNIIYIILFFLVAYLLINIFSFKNIKNKDI